MSSTAAISPATRHRPRIAARVVETLALAALVLTSGCAVGDVDLRPDGRGGDAMDAAGADAPSPLDVRGTDVPGRDAPPGTDTPAPRDVTPGTDAPRPDVPVARPDVPPSSDLDPALALPDPSGAPCSSPGSLGDCPGIAVCRFYSSTEGRCESCEPCGNLNDTCTQSSECDILFMCFRGRCTNFCTLGSSECGPPADCINIGHPTRGVCRP